MVWSEDGEFKPDACHIQPIPRKYKPGLLAWLRSQGIHRESVYRDIHGYVGLIKKAWLLIHAGSRLVEQGEFESAEKILDKAQKKADAIEQRGKALLLLGEALESQCKYKKALRRYEDASKFLLHRANGTEPRLAAARCLKALNQSDCADAVIKSIDDLWK